MIFEIDVSGEDIFDKNYSICIADKDGKFIKGFKFEKGLIQVLRSRQGQGMYKYSQSKTHKGLFKIRIYSIVIYYIFSNFNLRGKDIRLEICRDFEGHEGDIMSNLTYFLTNILGIKLEIKFTKLLKGKSIADKYATLMRMDTKNQLPNYIRINLKEFEKFLIK